MELMKLMEAIKQILCKFTFFQAANFAAAVMVKYSTLEI
jgi:hypothetical protein